MEVTVITHYEKYFCFQSVLECEALRMVFPSGVSMEEIYPHVLFVRA